MQRAFRPLFFFPFLPPPSLSDHRRSRQNLSLPPPGIPAPKGKCGQIPSPSLFPLPLSCRFIGGYSPLFLLVINVVREAVFFFSFSFSPPFLFVAKRQENIRAAFFFFFHTYLFSLSLISLFLELIRRKTGFELALPPFFSPFPATARILKGGRKTDRSLLSLFPLFPLPPDRL